MKELNNEELMNIDGGGFSISAAFLNATARLVETILDAGRSLGSSIRRIYSGNICSF